MATLSVTRKPTVRDVARLAGVSVGTVSNVLNDRGNVSVGRGAQVRAAIAQLDFVPNSVAQSLRRSEPVVVALKVNRPYPEGVPLQTTPPSLLLSLPKLPPEVEYRVVGHALVLRDVAANLIVDYAPNTIP